MSNDLTAIFVYGTLKKGKSNHYLLKDSIFLNEFSVKGFDLVFDNHESFPFLVRGKGIVHGEIYLVTSSTLALIDNLEGHPHFYKREIIQDIFNYEKKYSLWSYLFEKSQLSELNLIKNGIF
tara:strand:- start:20942 stop:21307 length:366 start_codon:yes stop_codon:yes gene_type:complete